MKIIFTLAGSKTVFIRRAVAEMNLSNLISEKLDELKFVLSRPAALLDIKHGTKLITDHIGNTLHIFRIGAKAVVDILMGNKNALFSCGGVQFEIAFGIYFRCVAFSYLASVQNNKLCAETVSGVEVMLVKFNAVVCTSFIAAEEHNRLKRRGEGVDGTHLYIIVFLDSAKLVKNISAQLGGGVKKDLRSFCARSADRFQRLLDKRRIEARGRNTEIHLNTCLFSYYFSTILTSGKDF